MLGMAAVCSVFYWDGNVQAAFGVSGSLLAVQKLRFNFVEAVLSGSLLFCIVI